MAEVALAILTVGDGYALQHRDDIPSIAAAGHWALFGGTVADGEEPATWVAVTAEKPPQNRSYAARPPACRVW